MEVPLEYQAWYDQTNAFLDKKLVEWRPSEYRAMEFGAYHVFASSQQFFHTDLELNIKFMDVLNEAGVDVIAIAMFPSSSYTEAEMQRYDRIVEKIRDSGKKLMIFYWYSGEKLNSFEEFKAVELETTEMIVERYKPEYYALIDEPTTRLKEAGMPKSSVSLEEWKALAEEVSNKVKEINPLTKTIASVHKGELDYVDAFVDVPSLDIIGFNIYGREGIYEGYSGWVGEGDVVGRKIDFANSKGKETWIIETWLTLQNTPGFNEGWRQGLDAKWLRLMAYYAQRHDMNGIVPFFTVKFIAYFDPETITPRDVENAFAEERRTEVFYAYREVINEVR